MGACKSKAVGEKYRSDWSSGREHDEDHDTNSSNNRSRSSGSNRKDGIKATNLRRKGVKGSGSFKGNMVKDYR